MEPSEGQLKHAPAHDQVQYILAPAEATTVPNASADCIIVAQALHW